MRQYSKVSPTVWRSKKFRKLDNDDAKLAYFYLITCPHSNSAGCYDLPLVYGGSDLGWELKRFEAAVDSLSSVGLVSFDSEENTILISSWAKFNPPTNAKHALGLINELESASSDKLKAVAAQDFREIIAQKSFSGDVKILRTIESKLKAMESLSEAYQKAIATRLDETETETELDDTNTETREKRTASCAAATPDGAARPPLGEGNHLTAILDKRGR